MLHKHEGLPEDNEIVLCQVTKLFPNSVFVDLLEYGQSGMIHISEVSPGRIRNLREFVSIGRQIVCKVLRIDQQRGHIDLSLRRVNSTERQEKLEENKQELKAEQLVKNLAKKLHQPAEKLYQKISGPIFKSYSHLYLCFREVASGEASLKMLGIDSDIADELTAVVIDKFKPQKVAIQGEIALQTYDSRGIDKIKQALLRIQQVSSTISLLYFGAGKYKLTIEDVAYQPAEEHLTQVEQIIQEFQDKMSTASFVRHKE